MEDEKLKIIEIKKCRKKINKALLSKCADMFFATGSVWYACINVRNFIESRNVNDLAVALCMLFCYVNLLKFYHKDTDIINTTLDEEIDLEKLVEKEGLTK